MDTEEIDFAMTEPEAYPDPFDTPAKKPGEINPLDAADPDHVFGPSGYCHCTVHESKAWLPCTPESPEAARIEWDMIIGACWRPKGNAAPIPYEPAAARSRPKPKRSPARKPDASPGLWDESEIIP